MTADTATSKILIVEDDNLNAKLLAANMKGDGYRISVACDGEACLDAVEQDPPDLILLDVMMPGMDGYEVCRRLKSDTATRGIPVLFISAMSEIADKRRGFDSGGVDYITKPFDQHEVKSRVATHLALKHANDALQDQNDTLDRQVQERTAALSVANRNLRQEIEDKEKAFEALKRSEIKIRAVIDAIPDEVWQIRADGTIQHCKRGIDTLPFGVERVTGLSLKQILPSHALEAVMALVRDTLGSARVNVLEIDHAVGSQTRYFEIRMARLTSDEVVALIRDITEKKQMEAELRQQQASLEQENLRLRASMRERYRLCDIIGKSEVMQTLYDTIVEAAAHDINVMVNGESGTGKELVARAIHTMSSRCDKPFVPVNCGAIPENLIESEFFGYQKGAFTGADRDKPGYLDLAEGGTLFLDEIGEISLGMQVKLLRAIEGNGYVSIGGDQTRHHDVRFIGATNSDPAKMVKQGKMREDFFYRIHVVNIKVPPLRERSDDLPLLIDHFYNRFAKDDNAPPPITGQLYKSLLSYHWPGNVRELQNTLHRYITTGKVNFMGTSIAAKADEVACPVEDESLYQIQDFKSALEAFEKQYIVRALENSQWHRERAAAHLNIPRRTFFRKLKILGINTAAIVPLAVFCMHLL